MDRKAAFEIYCTSADDAAAKYREFSGLPTDGVLGRKALAGLGLLHCGHVHGRAQHTLHSNPWGKTHLNGCFGEPRLRAKPDRPFIRAFNTWAAHIPLRFAFGPTTIPCDIMISWETVYCGGVACTDYPPNGSMLRMRFSDKVKWYGNFPLPNPHPPEMDDLLDLQAFATHEFGHALGLDDDYANRDSIMYYAVDNGKHTLSPTDITNVKAIYT